MVAGGSSVVIAAACHRPEADEDACLKPVKWGVPTKSLAKGGGGEGDGYGHCCITSEEVEMPVEGQWYAGQKP